jgi:FKBP-type peptidyl-prolyl cis-trans isomerase
MGKTKISHRIFALTLAILFFVTSFGFTFLILWQMHQQSNADKAAASSQSTNQGANKVSQNSNKLQGTRLANFTPTNSISSLQTTDTVVGTGTAATASSTVTVDYTGAVASTGIVFQSSLDSGQPATFGLNQVIKGWTEGIPGMKVGGTRRLLIPAALAYGANPPSGSGISPNADLIFDVTLKSVK